MLIKKNNLIFLRYWLKQFCPPVLLVILRKIKWSGNYSNYELARIKTTTYNNDAIFFKVLDSTKKVLSGEVAFERDGVLFDKVEYSFGLLSSLFYIANKEKKLNVVDFGGSLGSTFLQNRLLINFFNINWSVVEQEKFVKIGNENISMDNLKFFQTIEDALNSQDNEVLLLSSVIQYLEDPWDFLEKVASFEFKYIVLDRTAFNRFTGMDRLTIQRVDSEIQSASYPCWFLDKERFSQKMLANYSLIFEWDALDIADVPSEFKGFLFEKKLI